MTSLADADRAGEGDVFAERLVEELPRLVRLATRLLRDADVAEDCAQETILGAWRRRDQLRDPAALPAWLRRSLVNRVVDRSRSHHHELDIEIRRVRLARRRLHRDARAGPRACRAA